MPLLKYILPSSAKTNGLPEESGEDGTKQKSSRSSHQRLQAIEILSALEKASQKNAQLLAALTSNIEHITSVMETMVTTSSTWPNKKVKKTMLVLNLYCKLTKTMAIKDSSSKSNIEKSCAKIIKVIE